MLSVERENLIRVSLEALENEIQRASRLKGSLSILLLDLDHFKEVNDTYGHSGGDQALLFLADTCRANLRVVDTVGRSGGDEFVIAVERNVPV